MENKTTILYVDDEPMNLKLFEINFSKKFNVITALSGNEGLKVLAEKHHVVNVVISDMKMPGMNGIEFIKKAKSDYPDIKYFILTGFEITEEIAEALNNNLIQSYFQKPFNMQEIEESIFEFL
ncbi:MAG: response regulator [Bacteroidales bacterium]|jgi:response regulator RpfG family c-di-GMP phosphodiesterase|nr:response regulator [Bacteroidales bacterium]